MQNDNRLVYADQLKCLAIILVVIGHVLGSFGLGDISFCHFIGTFHTMLFIFLSGYFSFKPNNDIINWNFFTPSLLRKPGES